jgi:hypothetical protein
MADPITTDDLYGTSKDQTPPAVVPEPMVETPPKPLHYEETPEVPMPSPSSSPVKRSGCLGKLFTAIVFLALFIGGIWLSSFVRQFFPTNTPSSEQTENTGAGPAVTPQQGTTATGSAAVAVNGWKTYEVISGTTKAAFGGVTYQLPIDVLAPICDGTGCASQGTYLPGGTRFTVAPRGAGQALRDFRGSVISDVGGVSFTSKATTVAGRPGMEFTGVFTGRTISGYGFSRMRGVMIELTPTTSLEVNHFTPNGIVADFTADEKVFDAILKTIKIVGSATTSATLTPTRTPTPTTVNTVGPTATPSAN